MGFGLLFIGMGMMTDSVSTLRESELFVRLFTTPVSYTHLDVYKRQEVYIPPGTARGRGGHCPALQFQSLFFGASFGMPGLSLIHI